MHAFSIWQQLLNKILTVVDFHRCLSSRIFVVVVFVTTIIYIKQLHTSVNNKYDNKQLYNVLKLAKFLWIFQSQTS